MLILSQLHELDHFKRLTVRGNGTTSGELMTCENLRIASDLKKLYGYLLDRGCINALDNYSGDCLRIFSREILKRIKEKDSSWENMVPKEVAVIIKDKNYFGFQPA